MKGKRQAVVAERGDRRGLGGSRLWREQSEEFRGEEAVAGDRTETGGTSAGDTSSSATQEVTGKEGGCKHAMGPQLEGLMASVPLGGGEPAPGRDRAL